MEYDGKDGEIVHLQATNTPPGDGEPVDDAVPTIDRLVAMASATNWYD